MFAIGQVPRAMVNLGEPADRREVFRRSAEDVLELLARLVVATELEQRSTERHPRRKIGGMPLQTGEAGGNRFVVLAGAPVFLGERRKRNRRRVQLNPASQFFYSAAIGQRQNSIAKFYGPTETCPVTVLVRPTSSVTVSVTM